MSEIKVGLLKVEVKAPKIIAGQSSIVNLLITNPFSETVYIESIQAPSSSLLKKRYIEKHSQNNPKEDSLKDSIKESFFSTMFKNIKVSEIGIGPIIAHFPKEKEGRTINVKMEKNSKLNVIGNIELSDTLNIVNKEGAEVVLDLQNKESSTSSETTELRKIEASQEDIASFKLQTASWLLTKPTKLELHALIQYRIGTDRKSQIIPINLFVQPPVKSIVIGSIIGGTLGYLTRQVTNNGINIGDVGAMGISLLGVVLMTTIAAIILSRNEESKGFITLEDFYGAFFVGTMTGYIGTEYFDGLLSKLDK